MNQTVQNEINSLFVKLFEIPIEKLRPEATLIEDLGLDSLDRVDMIIHIEDLFNIKVSDEAIVKIVNLQDIYQFVSDQIEQKT